MNLIDRYEDTLLITFFTEGMLLDVGLSYPVTGTSISALCLRISPVLLILSVDQLLMFGTVTLIRQRRTSRITAWMLRLSWHSITSGQNKSPEGICIPQGFGSFYNLVDFTISQRVGAHVCSKVLICAQTCSHFPIMIGLSGKTT